MEYRLEFISSNFEPIWFVADTDEKAREYKNKECESKNWYNTLLFKKIHTYQKKWVVIG